MDRSDPIVRLCADGMLAEGAGDHETAARLFREAWDARSDDADACIAAHYLARHQPTPEETLAWNERALAHADRADPARVAGFHPSLHLNLGRSYEDAGDLSRAHEQYMRAEARLGEVQDDGYAALVRRGVTAGLLRTG